MRTPFHNRCKLPLLTSLFCSLNVLMSVQAFATTPTVSLHADKEKGNIAESGRLGYVGGSTRVGISIDKHLQGQMEINQIIAEDDVSATSVEGWFGYQLKDQDGATKGVKGGGVKVNHLWAVGDGRYEDDSVHKVFGAYDQDADDHAKVTLGYGQEQEDLFWSGQVSKGVSGSQAIEAAGQAIKAYDYGVGAEVGTFFDSTLTRLRGGVNYEWGEDHADYEERPEQATISAGVQQYFYDSPHSLTFDVSASKKRGGATKNEVSANNARLGYHYEFAKKGVFQSEYRTKRTRVEIPGVAAIAAIPAVPAIAGVAGRAAKYAKKAVRKPYMKLVKTTLKLENETFFKLNSAKLTASAEDNLLKIAAEIKRNQYMGYIRVTGNTCGLGSAKYDQILSERRAKSVRRFLVKQGLNPRHLVARGLGKGHPKYPNGPESGFKNRRVDVEYVTQRSTKKKAYRTEYKNVLVSPAVKAIAGRAGKPGRTGVAAVPARYVWQTEEIRSAPLWIRRALHNPIRHQRGVNTYRIETTPAVIAKDDHISLTNRDSLLDVLVNDGEGLVLVDIVAAPAQGVATIENGKIHYIANAGEVGDDRLTYEVADSNGHKQTAVVYITIPEGLGDANVAPVAVDDLITTAVDTVITYNLISNDTDADGDTLSLVSVSTPSYGFITQNGNEITYTPNKDFNGTDIFSYIVSDDKGHQATGQVVVTVSGVKNSAPVAVDNAWTTGFETSITRDIVSNDTDADGDALTLVSHTDPSNGSVTFNGNEMKYVPNAGFSGEDSFQYTVKDSAGNEATATVTIKVKEEDNARPVAVDDDLTTTYETAISYDVVANDTDPEDGVLSLVDHTNPSHGSVSINANEITYTPDSGFTGTDSFEYSIKNGEGKQDSAVVTIQVGDNGSNQAPNLSPNYIAINGNETVLIPVLEDDTDPDGDTLSLVNILEPPQYGTATIKGNEVQYIPHTNKDGQDSFRYEVTDHHGHTASTLVKIKLNKYTGKHVGASDDYVQINSSSDPETTINVVDNDSDIESHDLTVKLLTKPSYGIAYSIGNKIVFKPNDYYKNYDQFDYQVCDANQYCDTATVFVSSVKRINSKPVIADISSFTVTREGVSSIDISQFVSDADDNPVRIISAEALSGSVTFNGLVVQYMPKDTATSDRINVTVDDDNGGTATTTLLININ